MWTNECCVCGKNYEVCVSCQNIKNLNPWRTICDTEEHYQVYVVVKDYNTKKITANDAKTMLENVNFDVNTISEYKDNVQKSLREIFRTRVNKKSEHKITENE
jgi:hypothetical protein